MERKFLEFSLLCSKCSTERKFHGNGKVPSVDFSLPGTKMQRNEKSRYLLLPCITSGLFDEILIGLQDFCLSPDYPRMCIRGILTIFLCSVSTLHARYCPVTNNRNCTNLNSRGGSPQQGSRAEPLVGVWGQCPQKLQKHCNL